MMLLWPSGRRITLWLFTLLLAHDAWGEPVRVLYRQGSAHGFVEVTTVGGARIGVGDLLQKAHGNEVRSELKLRFFDGSLDDETTVYVQRANFIFVSDHHVQRGPSFPQPIDTTIDARHGLITTVSESGVTQRVGFSMPPDTYNGLASTLLMNVSPAAPETRISAVVAADKPRIIHLSMTNAGEVPITMGGIPREATDFAVHVELGGVAAVVAPLIGKQPLDYHVLILSGSDPAFIREEGQLYTGGPVWRIQQVSAAFPPRP